MSSTSKTVLITGANRGIGLHLAQGYLKNGYKVIAACRDPSMMPDIGGGDKVVPVQLDQANKTDAKQAAEKLKGQGIDHIDILIANAAVNVTPAPFRELDMDDMKQTFNTNIRGPLVLFQAFLPLLPKGGKFVVVSSGAGTIGQKHKPGSGVYGQSKAAINFMIAKMNVEQPDHVIMAINPGWVQTDMGNQGARWNGMDQAPLEATFTCPQMIEQIDKATKDNFSGKMIEYDGSTMNW